MPDKPFSAAMTGDVVGSQGLPPEAQARLPELLRDAAAFAFPDQPFEVFRGDSWQAFCPDPRRALAQALAFRACLVGRHGFDSRIAIGIGPVDSIRPEKISLSQGEAFTLSGRALNDLDDDRRLAAAVSPQISESLGPLLDAATILLDCLVSGWTDKQARAVALATTEAPQNELAGRSDPPISPQAFGKRLASAHWKPVRHALESVATGIDRALAQR